MKTGHISVMLLAVVAMAAWSAKAAAQAASQPPLVAVSDSQPLVSQPVMDAEISPGRDTSTPSYASMMLPQIDESYTRPSASVKLHNYLFDAFGPYPIIAAAFAAGINQATDSPPEWRQGAEAYGKRFGSNMGIVAIGTTTRFGLAAAMREDTLYYRCDCSGLIPRLNHALIATFQARQGDSGRHVFSVPALVSPYAGTVAAVYGWYPDRYGPKDAFRMGNYVMLGYVGQNLSMEFIHGEHFSLLAKLHLNNRRGAEQKDSSQSDTP
jgi:hypothetical protein